jgi:hypothetical protein
MERPDSPLIRKLERYRGRSIYAVGAEMENLVHGEGHCFRWLQPWDRVGLMTAWARPGTVSSRSDRINVHVDEFGIVTSITVG